MWFGDINVGDDSTGMPVADTGGSSSTDSWVRLAANLADAIHPYKTGVPVNVAISPQTQTFLLMGFAAVAGLLLLNMVRK